MLIPFAKDDFFSTYVIAARSSVPVPQLRSKLVNGHHYALCVVKVSPELDNGLQLLVSALVERGVDSMRAISAMSNVIYSSAFDPLFAAPHIHTCFVYAEGAILSRESGRPTTLYTAQVEGELASVAQPITFEGVRCVTLPPLCDLTRLDFSQNVVNVVNQLLTKPLTHAAPETLQ